ncbi:hypothetical protein H0W26_04220 [Candidatus Dependentiae bacterium]|nr:hypothetical protein [Candidatus Dependentiae bacterium]
MIFFFWPLPLEIFMVLVGASLSLALLVFMLFPDHKRKIVTFLGAFYSLSTALYMGYSVRVNKVLWPAVDWRIALLELLIVSAIGLTMYYKVTTKEERA